MSDIANHCYDHLFIPHEMLTRNELIMSNVWGKVQFMYWPNRCSLYANDIYYQPTLGLDGIE